MTKKRYKKKKKRLFIPIFIIFIVLCVAVVYVLYRFNYIPHIKFSNAYFNIETYVSEVDKDHDGIDDQSDILKNVRNYISTKPKYKSAYYESGYPNDEYGVCSDVVAFGLLDAGYDLQKLVDEDIKEHPERYDVDKRDNKIDFRRVKNLRVFFKHNAISLTTDIYDIDQWQGGDIVVFKKHIGIVSDKRNFNGVTFAIHHGNPYQRFYEEDILEYRNDIVGHYRMS